MKLSSILRISCILSNRGLSPEDIQMRVEKDRILLRNVNLHTYTGDNINSGDLEYFFYVFAAELILQ